MPIKSPAATSCELRDQLEAAWQTSRHAAVKARGRLHNFAATDGARKRAATRLAAADQRTSLFLTALQDHRREHGC